MLRTVTSIQCRPRSLVDIYTSTFLHARDGAGVPVGFSVPVPACPSGLTVCYYTRRMTDTFDYFAVYVDGQNGLAGGLDSQNSGASGCFNGGFFTNGVNRPTGGPRYYIYGSKATWTLVQLRTAQATGPGALFFNSYAGNPGPYGMVAADFARVVVYYRPLTDAELAAPLLPSDYGQLYDFSQYSPGDTVLPEATSSGLDGTIYY